MVGVARFTIGYHETYVEWILLPGYEVNWMGRGHNWTVSSDHIIVGVSTLVWFVGAFGVLVAPNRFLLNWISRLGFLCVYVGAVVNTVSRIPWVVYD